ncbi:MAG TPA: PQQ-binding-like beta-propeller repeat protein, partial [Candidatus Bathyarchaeia archaeon]
MKQNKKSAFIALLLITSMTISFFALPTANALSVKTYPVFGCTPNPVGVGQETLILVGITQATASALYGWSGITVTVTRPDGTTETLGPFKTDSTGLTGYSYRPSMVGNYTMVMHYPEQLNPATIGGGFTNPLPVNSTMLASDSNPLTLVVQEEPITYYPGFPLPTEYWTRPIDDQLREWSPIAGNWLTTPRNFYAVGNAEAPESSHILWTTPLTSGGLVGGALNAYDGSEDTVTNIGHETGDAYEGKWSGSLIMSGKLFYQKYASADAFKEVACVDLHTGKELWSRVLLNNLTLSRGQQHYWQTYDNQGVYDYLWATGNTATRTLLGLNSSAGTVWCAFDPFNGDFVYALYNMPSGTFTYGPRGEFLIYNINLNAGTMMLWNSTNVPQLYAGTSYLSMAWGQWRPMGKIVNATGPAGVTREGQPFVPPTMPLNLAGYQWNKTIPTGLPGSVRAVFPEDKAVGALINSTHVISWAINLKPGQEGQLLYKTTWNAPTEWLDGYLSVSLGAISNIDKVFTVNTRENGMRYGFSTETGEYLWKLSEPLAMLAHLVGGPSGESGYIAYGMLYCGTMSGVIQAFDVKTGQLAWKYEVKDPYMQVYWSNNWPMGHLIVADGKVYLANLEHSVNQPLPRGGPFLCLNATTGEEIWRANGLFRQTVWGGRAVMGDSIIATMDTYDQRIYGIGKGPSAMTVEAPMAAITLGSSLVIRGTVTDVSPGTESDSLRLRFANGVPAVSDESMSDWMLYVYKQFPRPTDAKGVDVTLSVVDANGNFREIGTTKADSDGFFSYHWTPDIEGKYT